MKEHRGARSGRDDYRRVVGEHFRCVTNHLARRDPIAAVESGLAAAGLSFGKIHLAAEVFEYLHSRYRGVVEKRVAKARGHQLNSPIGGGQGAVSQIHEVRG